MLCLKCKTETSNPKFCSQSCAASVNNRGVRRHGSAPVQRKCAHCKSKTPNPKFCSRKCQGDSRAREGEKQFQKGLIRSPTHIRIHMLRLHGNTCSNPRCAGASPAIQCEVDHKDGNWENNKPSNLRLLCPNCHSLTPTYRHKNVGHGRPKRYARQDLNLRHSE